MVQLVTGSLFVENLQAALVLGMMSALWRFDDSSKRRYLNIGMLLGGAALSVKFGSVIFVLLALPFAVALTMRHRKALGARPAAAVAVAVLLLLAAALPPYAIAYAKTGDPLFPYLNQTFHSPLLSPAAEVQDFRYRQPLTGRTLYDLTFRSSIYYEGQNGSFGFQYLILAPLAALGLAVVGAGAARSAAVVALGAFIVVLISTPNARYVYPALPLLMAPCAAVLAWMLRNQRSMARVLIAYAIVCAAVNLYFFPSGSYSYKEFYLQSPFSALERQRFVHRATPIREVIAWFNRAHPSAPVLLADESTFAGLTGEVYENHWHQFNTMNSLSRAKTVPDAQRLLQSWNVAYVIAHKPLAGERPRVLGNLLAACGAMEFESGDIYLARLDPSCAGQPSAAENFVASPGVYDDFDPAVRFKGEWTHDENFKEPALGTISYSDMAGAEFSLAFSGKALTYIFTMAPNRGIAAVTIDGLSQGAIDLYSPQVEWQTRRRFCCFGPGRHVLTVRVTGQANASSKGRFVDVDSIEVE
jgi:hypothetical protein